MGRGDFLIKTMNLHIKLVIGITFFSPKRSIRGKIAGSEVLLRRDAERA